MTEQEWIALVEDSIKKGYGKVLVPMSGMSEDAVIALAARLDISVFEKGSDYLFSATKEETQKLLIDPVLNNLDDDGRTH